MIEMSISSRHSLFVVDQLFLQGTEIVPCFGKVNNFSTSKKEVVRGCDFDFPLNGDLRFRLKAYDKGFQLAGK